MPILLGKKTEKGKPIYLNHTIYTLCEILKHVVALSAEAELGELFINAKEGNMMRLTLVEMGHMQPPTPIHTNNITANETGVLKWECGTLGHGTTSCWWINVL